MEKLRVIEDVKSIFGMTFLKDDCIIILDNCIINSYVESKTQKVVSAYIDLTRFSKSEIVENLNILRKFVIADNII